METFDQVKEKKIKTLLAEYYTLHQSQLISD